MGKYMKKSKITANVVAMEVPKSTTTTGVCTRAKTLASQRFQSHSVEEARNDDASCYLELRSRRLQKISVLDSRTSSNRSSTGSGLRGSGSANSVPVRTEKEEIEDRAASEAGNQFDLGVEASSGESNLGISTKERESTPCSFAREGDVATPGSSTGQRYLHDTNHTNQNDFMRFRDIPSSFEMEEFFIRAEQQQQQQQEQFIDKYNYDIFGDTPLPGRYDWFV